MSPITIIAIILIALGVVAFTYQGITYTTREKVIDLDPIQISVETYKGVVQLSGFVDSQKAIDKAGQIARSVDGVQSVKNNLIVK